MHNDSEKFIQKTCEQVRFKAAHKGIEQELAAHIEDNMEEFIAQGLDEKTASEKAIKCMGDPIEIGGALNKVHRSQTEWGVICLSLLLSIFGVGTMFFIGDLPAGNSSIFAIKQVIYTMIGMGLLVGLYFYDYTRLHRFGIGIFLSGMVLTMMTILFGDKENGVFFFEVGQISFSTASICSFIFMVCMIAELSKCKGKGITAFLKICTLCTIALISLFINSAFTLGFTMLIVYAVILTVAAVKGHFNVEKKWGYIFTAIGICVMSLMIVILHSIQIYNPKYMDHFAGKYLEGARWIGESKFLNVHGWTYLPKNWTDFFLTIIVTNFGWIAGCLILAALIALFTIMIFRTVSIKNTFGFYLSVGIIVSLITSFMFSIVTEMGYMNNLDSSLSFVSFGGTNYLHNIFAVGLFLSIWKRNLIVPKDMHSGLFQGGQL
ncbi:FtsW/RodA/SpoVE family cell cycle protein [Bacillus sp. CLL-7-23]|uniref:FtsW/RodA/SpoVE family cell cycle protein n=1 Tax=Bacillus changyiensis TaxID=3004103 RepID=A0ABT4WYJ1_9BACI|nr:FtsW/RodA/SpoVE family cell cycle protein [Bacillus changyiensis]MDA7025111.1 FtsW/RodA/SpoVE family cell cycle protein [Bacillus changyiensis]